MGRHAGAAPREGATGRAEVLGWGVFTAALCVGALLWAGVGWPVAAAVGGTVVAGAAAVAGAMTFAPRTRGSGRPERSDGSSPEPDRPPR